MPLLLRLNDTVCSFPVAHSSPRAPLPPLSHLSVASRSISVRNGSVMEEWDNNMRVMRNELFSMCGLLAEAEGELKAAMERADERVNYVTTAIFNTMGQDGEDGGSSSRVMEKGALKLGREDYVDFRLELGVIRQRLKGALTTCQNCILALEDDLDSISEQVSFCSLSISSPFFVPFYFFLLARPHKTPAY